MRYDELSPGRLIDILRAWFHARDRSVVLDDGTFLEVPEISAPGTPPAGRSRIYSLKDTPGWGLYHLDDQGRERQFSGDVMAWQAAVSSILALPGLRAFWPMSAVDYTNPQAKDVAGGGYHLTNNNTATFGYDPNQVLVPCAFFDGVNQYLSRADGGAANWADIIGTEAYIENTLVGARGLTLGGWFWADTTTIDITVMGKGISAAGAYWLRIRGDAADQAQFSMFSGAVQSAATGNAVIDDTWTFLVGRFDPSTELGVFQNGVWTRNAVGIPATIDDVAGDFTIGARAGGTNFLPGRAGPCFLCAAALDDAAIDSVFQQTRGAFGV